MAAIRAAARVLPEGGRIVNIGSGVATRTGAGGVADHAGTKAALAGFTRGAARDLAPRGIAVNLLQTGLVATQLNTGAGSAHREGAISSQDAARSPREPGGGAA